MLKLKLQKLFSKNMEKTLEEDLQETTLQEEIYIRRPYRERL